MYTTCRHTALALTSTHLMTVITCTKNMKASYVTYMLTGAGTLVTKKSQAAVKHGAVYHVD
jgi:hypothetical protein